MGVKTGKAVDIALIRRQLDDVMNELEMDAEAEEAEEEAEKELDEEIDEKVKDEKILKNLEDDLGTTGTTTKARDQEVLKTVLKMMRDLAKDPRLDPHKTTRKTLRAKKLDPKTIDEIMKLKHIYEECEDGKPVDIKHLRQEIDEVIKEMDEDVEFKKSQRDNIKSKDEVLHKKHDADML